MGYVCFGGIITVFYLKIIFFELMLMDISNGWILRKSANFQCQS